MNNEKENVKCIKCQKIITEKTDINIMLYFLKIQIYCNNCYSSLGRGMEQHFGYSKYPINSATTKFLTWFMTILLILGLLLLPFYPLLNFIPLDTRITAAILMPLWIALVYFMWKAHFNAKKIINKLK